MMIKTLFLEFSPVIEREPRASFLVFTDGSSIVLREDGKVYPAAPYPPSEGWYPGIQVEDLQAFKFFALVGKARTKEIIKGGTTDEAGLLHQ